jgi:hypothetical protein
MLKWVNKAIVFSITMSGIYISSNYLLNMIQPYLRSGIIGSIQLYSFGFCAGFVGAMVVDNLLKLGVIVLNKYI